ncbi:MAG TPA: SDR family oxidoreductase [Chloroflexota bacterium]|nr:SDR family oxidoreductase [Chloroflexota bacterium]
MGVLDLLRLDSKVALVTGGSRGLGLQIAEGLGEAGAVVAITARRAPGLAEAEAHLRSLGIRCLTVPCDITDHDAVEAAVAQVVAELGGIDVLVNNAGATWGAPLQDISLEGWDKVIRTNVTGTFYVSRAVALAMIRQGRGGRIVNVASVAGLRGSDPRVMQSLPYNTSKGAVVNFTRDLAVKLAEHAINVNCICPGFFPTRMTAWTLDHFGDLIKDSIPLRRLGGPEDLKGLAVFLASPASAYITGQVIAVDGGATAM